jgi:hypothetical protein
MRCISGMSEEVQGRRVYGGMFVNFWVSLQLHFFRHLNAQQENGY